MVWGGPVRDGEVDKCSDFGGQKKVVGLWPLGMDGKVVVEERLELTGTLRNPLQRRNYKKRKISRGLLSG